MVLVALLITFNIAAQGGDTFNKEIRKEFPVNPQTRIEVSNKYGNVDITNMEDAQISIRVVVLVKGKDQRRAEEVLKMINIHVAQEGDLIKAVTEIDDDFGKLFKGFNTGSDGLEINYTISMPKTVPITLLNKYGNVFIDELSSTSVIDVKYGKLTANRLIHNSHEPLTKVNLSYSNGTLQEAKWIELDIKYSKISIVESKALAIISKYSKVFITNGSSVVSESKYDTYELGSLTNFVSTAAYGHFTIESLTGKLQLDTKYTDVTVNQITEGFAGIKVNNSYGSYRLGIVQGASYRLNGYSKYCSITYPSENARVNRFNENNEMKVNGVIGANSNPKGEVSINSSYGNIRLMR
ncbi:MAG: DUF4097 family beta strand repeat protein [Bacteroidales bacterium]|nr:DUF4097 family beta strand repeat protein [Bacteroidales bacterium]